VKKVAVLGGGLVGGLVAADLAADREIETICWDAAAETVARLDRVEGLTARRADLRDPSAVGEAVRDADAVAVAVPGSLGTQVVRAVLARRKPLVDISFSPEDPFLLDDAAKDAGVPAVVDCGVAPGLSNLLAGRAAAELDRTDRLRILVGGLPFRRVWPWEYRLVFSLTDVLEEYTRPARYRQAGVERTRPALSDVELLEFDGIGTLEAFLTDGSRTLLRTMDAPDLVEKTLRWPGHVDRVRVLRETGFLDRGPVPGLPDSVSARAVSEAILARAWRLPEGEEEFTVLRVEVEGARGGRSVRIVYDLFDRTDPATGATSMARTTGFPCAIVARMLARGEWTRPGVAPPEFLGRDARVTASILDALSLRGVRVGRREESPPDSKES
jgi:saccharopine dehydrogenase-like NADP-dependent oxidoreductase